MSISINNSLPSVHLIVGLIADFENKMKITVDSGTTMNTGNKGYHQWVIFQRLSMISEYLESGTNIEYDFIQLLTV